MIPPGNNSNFKSKYLRQLPAVGKILEHPKVQNILTECPRPLLLEIIRNVIDSYKNRILSSNAEDDIENLDISFDKILDGISASAFESSRMSLRRAINATGDVLVDTPALSETAQKALQDVSKGYSNLAVNRDLHIQKLLSILTGAETGLVLNNNAAAIMLALNSLAKDKEVIVSRGELVESDSFRLPDIIATSGAKMVPVGATNKTHLKDYSNAIGENAGAILKVRKENYRIIGFSEEVPIQDLVELGKKHNIPVIDNIGSGFLLDMTEHGFHGEPSAAMSVKYGADVVCLSGDKFLGGPQAGIIIAREEFMSLMKKNSLYPAFRPGKLTMAALEATLRLYLEPDRILTTIPALQFLARSVDEIGSMAQELVSSLTEKLGNLATISISDGYSRMDSISLPPERFPTKLISIKPEGISAEDLIIKLESRPVPIFAIANGDNIKIDLRTAQADEIDDMVLALVEVCG